MSAPEKIWVEPPYYTLGGEVPDITWEAHWDEGRAQSFDTARLGNMQEYIRADIHEALQEEVKRLREALGTIPDRIDIYRAFKRSGARKHGDLASAASEQLDFARAALEETTQ